MQEFRGLSLLDVSPDGKKLLLTSDDGQQSFVWRGWWQSADDHKHDGKIIVMEVDSGRVLYSRAFPNRVQSGSFFADSNTVYVSTANLSLPGRLPRQHVVIDWVNDKITEDEFETTQKPSIYLTALRDNALVGLESVGGKVVALVELPDYRERLRVPFATSQRTGFIGGRDRDPIVSGDRKFIVYAFEHTVVCRSTDDLRVAWTHALDSGAWGVKRISVTPNCERVAIAVGNGNGRSYIDILDGGSGVPVGRLPVDSGDEYIAISPDGRLLAVGVRREDGSETVPTVQLYDIAAGRIVVTIVHDRLRIRRGQYDFGSAEMRFTADGKYLVTSTIHTKVWPVP